MLFAFVARWSCPLNRPLLRYSSTSSSSFRPSAKLVAELRKKTTASIQKSREALLATNGDLTAAMEWLEKDQAITGQQKIEKLGTRTTGEGLVGISVLSTGSKGGVDVPFGIRAAIVELNCETDFVGRNDLFQKLTKDLAFTAALLSNPPSTPGEDTYTDTDFIAPLDLTSFQDAPLLIRDQLSTEKQIKVSDAVRNLITAVGENITIRRVASFVHQLIPATNGVGLRLAHYVHGALPSSVSQGPLPVIEVQGRIGTLAAIGIVTTPAARLMELLDNGDFETDLNELERALARQIVGMNPNSIQDLLSQSFDMLVGSDSQTVESVLRRWTSKYRMVESPEMSAIQPAQFIRWQVGETLTQPS